MNACALIDVRAPIEFQAGSLPGSVNLPIMNDHERAAVGTAYKQLGREAAMKLGHELVSGAIKQERVLGWCKKIQEDTSTILYCFRGGLRSQISQQWLKDVDVEVPIIEGGYKATRQLIMSRASQLIQNTDLMILTGMTGSGKTQLLREEALSARSIDLEGIARHRGSAFGIHEGASQPSQIDFENRIALAWERWSLAYSGSLLLEDESRLVGRCVLTDELFNKLRASAVVIVEESLDYRVNEILRDYVVESSIGRNEVEAGSALFDKYISSTKNIEKKLGGTRAKEILQNIEYSKQEWLSQKSLESNRIWIEKLLVWYYDPLYLGSRAKRNPKVLFAGDRLAVREFLKDALPREKQN